MDVGRQKLIANTFNMDSSEEDKSKVCVGNFLLASFRRPKDRFNVGVNNASFRPVFGSFSDEKHQLPKTLSKISSPLLSVGSCILFFVLWGRQSRRCGCCGFIVLRLVERVSRLQ